ncbi:MAG TPA: DUF6285 domain-containing protein [Candidatus Binatia bacterium]|jgi:hypothetical protein|nr:DUF6285 domain-containing protein [Candidatus Binatia bacterium]
MQDRPTAQELLAAVRYFLEHDIMPTLEGRRRFHTLVAANVLHIIERELTHEEPSLAAEWARLAALPNMNAGEIPTSLAALRTTVRDLTLRLSEKIRAGDFDDSPEVREHLRQTTVEKLRIANPRMLHE